MTTIAANRKRMAADQKVTHGEQHFRSGKLRKIAGAIVGGAGEDKLIAAMFKWLESGGDPPTFDKDDEFDILVLSASGLTLYACDTTPIKLNDEFYAIGTGGQAALAAMHMGATPKQAVEIACKVDISTEGPVDVLTLRR